MVAWSLLGLGMVENESNVLVGTEFAWMKELWQHDDVGILNCTLKNDEKGNFCCVHFNHEHKNPANTGSLADTEKHHKLPLPAGLWDLQVSGDQRSRSQT